VPVPPALGQPLHGAAGAAATGGVGNTKSEPSSSKNLNAYFGQAPAV
jgi:hypothetical protein